MVVWRTTYTLTVEVLSELHVGSGLTTKQKIFGNEETEVAALCVDDGGNPFIPGSTLKGALRASHAANDNRIFGQPHLEGSQFARGELSVFGFSLLAKGQTNTKMRTSVEQGTGASEARKLFAQRFVGIGAKFKGDWVLECREDRLQQATTTLQLLLDHFARIEGVGLGLGKADGLGRVRLTSVEGAQQRLQPEGWSKPQPLEITLSPAENEVWTTIEMVCPGPYLVFGGKVGSGGSEDPEVTVPERTGSLPRLFPTGVSGAVRARGNWLAELKAFRSGTLVSDTAVPVVTSSGLEDLDVVQRLFGSEGYRASLDLMVDLVRREGNGTIETTHPAGPLDPMLQAPLEGKLHRRKADSRVRIGVSLRLSRDTAREDERELFDALVADLGQNGLPLGSGTVKGFGWFNMTETRASSGNLARSANTQLAAEQIKRLPDPAIRLPYRQVEVATDRIGMPEPAVASAFRDRVLHSKPIAGALSGWVDVSWCFETPMLVADTRKLSAPLKLANGEIIPAGREVREPQRIDGIPVIPGTTLRGSIRSLIEVATMARLGRERLNAYDFPNKRMPNDNRTTFPLQGPDERLSESHLHNPGFGRGFEPDFAQALLGFISPDKGALDPELHAALHLKSRISFGWAWLASDLDREKSGKLQRVLLASPDATSVFMDHMGRRVYPVTSDDLQRVQQRISNAPVGRNDQMPSYLAFLHPSAGRVLAFRGRIRFHNVTEVELGALLWAITLGMNPGARHAIGQARPLGAGRCFAADLRLGITRNDGNPVTDVSSARANEFGPDGELANTYVQAFEDWLASTGLLSHGLAERLAAADPACGDVLQKGAGGAFVYQTNKSLGTDLRDNQKGHPKRSSIARSHGGGLNGAGRLAAMLKRR